MLADDSYTPFSPMALDVHRATGEVVGRPAELQAITQEMATARAGRLAALTVEGEPGIGKTRLLLAAIECAAAEGFAYFSTLIERYSVGDPALPRERPNFYRLLNAIFNDQGTRTSPQLFRRSDPTARQG